MTHIRYSRQYLEFKTIEFLKVIAERLGIAPSGDKRFKQNWIDAIIEHQASQIKQIEQEQEATISQVSENEFIVVVSGITVRTFVTLFQAETWAKANFSKVTTKNMPEPIPEAIESMTPNIETLFDAEDLEQHLEGLCLYSDFCHQSFIKDIEDPRKPVENRCYAISDMVFLEKNGNAVSREYEVWINGQFEYCVLAHTGIKPGYISWMFWADNYSSIPELVDAIHCHRGSGRKEEFAIL